MPKEILTPEAIEQLKKNAEFGRELWKFITDDLADCGMCLELDTEALMQLAMDHGKAQKVKYDPAIHGDNIEAEPGSEIWWWET